MRNFCLITNKYKDPGLEITRRIEEYISRKGGTTVSLISAYDPNDKEEFHPEDIPAETECIMVLGGDGTLIRAATKVQELQMPIIGVNLGTLGYLCEITRDNLLNAIDRLMEELYLVEDHIMLTGHKRGNTNYRLALNDVVIHHGGNIQVVKLNVYVNGEFLVQYTADGIIVATPTGSTGYSMSAGGPIVDPKGEMILLTPNNAHSIGSRSIVLSGDDEIEIEVDRSHYVQGKIYVSFDGDRVEELTSGDRFCINRAANRVHICKLNRRSFLEILSKKMESHI